MSDARTTVTDVEPLAGRWIRVSYADGAMHEVDLAPILEADGVFAAVRDHDQVFRAVEVDRAFGTLLWPDDTDLDPDVLRGDQAPAGASALPRRIVQAA